MTPRSALAVVTALALMPLSACGGANPGEGTKGEKQVLASYSREGGIRFQSSTLEVSTKGFALVRSEGCTVRFRLGIKSWRHLRRTLKQTDLSTLADDYPAPSGAADVIEETIIVGRESVRVGGSFVLPANARRELTPLLHAFDEVLDEGERRHSCRGGAEPVSQAVFDE